MARIYRLCDQEPLGQHLTGPGTSGTLAAMLLIVSVLMMSLAPACDISLENPGGSKAGASYSFTVTSSAVPVTVTVNVGPDQLQKITVNEKQQSVSITLPNDARGKTLEIIAENNDGCLVSWSETIQ